MDATGNTHISNTTKNSCDALDFISVGDSVDFEEVRLLCVILRRTTCEHRIRRAKALLTVKLTNVMNLSFIQSTPGGMDILTQIGMHP